MVPPNNLAQMCLEVAERSSEDFSEVVFHMGPGPLNVVCVHYFFFTSLFVFISAFKTVFMNKCEVLEVFSVQISVCSPPVPALRVSRLVKREGLYARQTVLCVKTFFTHT